MSGLVEILYPLPDRRRTPLSTIRWWESRRLVFNQVLGATGLVSLIGMVFFAALPPNSVYVSLEVLVGAAFYGALANVCYTLGWMIELLARLMWGRNAPNLGPLLFRQGTIFAVGLTFLPMLLSVIFWIVSVIGWILP
ncbi:hypothetical protein [Longimicrobium sp.]|uniref:hypothetical protein n=1 Tax=Longimicrobium sp. TaxID=2029185 RepID=UPI003B3B84DC